MKRSNAKHRASRRASPGQSGFTLLEVLLALVMVSLAVVAVLHSASVASRSAFELEQRFFARWVGSDQLASMKLAGAFPELGRQTGQRQLGRRTWNWEARVAQTPVPTIRRVEMIVWNDQREEMASLVGFLVGTRQEGQLEN